MTTELKRPHSMMFSLRGAGRQFAMDWPDDASTREVDAMLEIIHLQMRGVRREAELREAGVKNKGDLEWNSWFPKDHPMQAILKVIAS